MIVYQYRANAASYDAACFTVRHRDRDVVAVDAPDGVWQFLLTEGWLVLPPSVPLKQEAAPIVKESITHIEQTATSPVAPVIFPEFKGTPIPADYPNRLHYIRDGVETMEQLHDAEDDGA